MLKTTKILLVESRANSFCHLFALFDKDKYDLSLVRTVERAEECLEQKRFDLIIADRYLDDGDILTLVKDLRKEEFFIPVIILTTMNSSNDRIEILRVADDFLLKPFNCQELLLRAKNLLAKRRIKELRHHYLNQHLHYYDGALIFSEPHGQQEDVELRRQEQKVFECLLLNKNTIVSIDTISAHLWGYAYQKAGRRTINVYIQRLRVKLRNSAHYLQTVKGCGYRLMLDS